jgi:hypothetical protein
VEKSGRSGPQTVGAVTREFRPHRGLIRRVNWGNGLSCRLTASVRMAWVTIRGHRYYRRSRRVNGRFVTDHIGGGEFGELAAAMDDSARLDRKIDADLKRAEQDEFAEQLRDVCGIEQFLADVFAVLAVRCGFYQHRRQWRRTRRADPMSLRGQLDKLRTQIDKMNQRRPPLMSPDFSGIPEADRATLQAAAKGDAAALAKAEPYLTDPKHIKVWGDPMFAARCWLVTQVSGDDVVVARATHARVKLLREELGFVTANMLEKIAITRIVHNWLAVAALDAKACQQAVGSRERANAEKSLAQAERRLMQAVKTLAFLRDCSVAALMARIGDESKS